MRQIAAPTAVASVSPSSASLNPNASEFVSTRTPTAEQSGVEATPATPQASTAPAATAATPAATTATPVGTSGTPATITQAATPAAATPAATTATPVGTSGAPATITQAVTPAALTPVVVTPATAPLAMVQSVDESMPSTSAMPAVAQPGPSSMTASVAPTMKRYFFCFLTNFTRESLLLTMSKSKMLEVRVFPGLV